MGTFHPKVVFREARESEKQGRKREASAQFSSLSVYLRRRGRKKDAKVMIERAIALSPESPRLYIQLALCEIAIGDDRAARRATQQFTQFTIRRSKVEDYTPYLETQLRGYPSMRQIFYEALLDLDRTDAGPFLRLALAMMEQANHEGALRILLDALKTKTHEGEVLARLKQVLELRRDKKSLEHLASFEAGKLARNDLISLLSGQRKTLPPPIRPPLDEEKDLNTLISELEAQMGIDLKDHHDSIDPLIKEFRRKSESILDGDSKSRIDMALAFFEMGLVEDARDVLRPIRSTDSLYLESQCVLGEILYSERSDLGALEVFQNCLRDDRASETLVAEARYKLLLIYYRLGDLKQALLQATELDAKTPGYRDSRRLLAQIQESAKGANLAGHEEVDQPVSEVRKKA